MHEYNVYAILDYMKSYTRFKQQLLKDKGVCNAYNELKPEFDLIRIMIKKRIEQGLTQEKLARKIGTKQSSISRFESGDYNPTISFLKKVAHALGVQLKISVN